LTADARPDLGPRSLDPDRTFWCAFAECIWGQTSPADFCNCYDVRALSPSSHDPRWDERRDALPFLTCHALSLAEAVTSGEPRNVRRFRPRCRFLLAFTRFSRPRYLLRRATSADRSDGVLVAINVHGSEDQVKDASSAESRERRFPAFLVSGACASKSACGRRSLPRRPLDIRCRRCVRREGRRPVLDAGPNQDPRSDADPRRSTSSRRPGCLLPLRLRRAFESPDCSANRIPRVGPSLTPPTRSPQDVERCLHGPCKRQSAVTRDPWPFEEQAPLLPRGSILSDLSCLGLTTQARPSARPSWLVCES